MSEAVALTQVAPRALAGPLEFTPDQQKMIRDTFANGASPQEFAVLMEVAKIRRLNPLLRQVYFVKRWDTAKQLEVWSTQISIDGLRAVAERTGLYDGQDEPEYVYDETTGDLLCCKVKVYRKDWPRPAVGVAHFGEYAQKKKDGKLTSFWASKPHIMLAKCAEALAIRKAFPEDTGGLYVAEEMGQAPEEVDVSPPPEPKKDKAAAKNATVTAPPTEKIIPSPEQRSAAKDLTEKAAAQQDAPRRYDVNVIWKRLTHGRNAQQALAFMRNAVGDLNASLSDLTQEQLEAVSAELDIDGVT